MTLDRASVRALALRGFLARVGPTATVMLALGAVWLVLSWRIAVICGIADGLVVLRKVGGE